MLVTSEGTRRNILQDLSSRGFLALLLHLSYCNNNISAIRITSMKATRRRIQLTPTTAITTRTMTVLAAILSSVPVWAHFAAVGSLSAAACGIEVLYFPVPSSTV